MLVHADRDDLVKERFTRHFAVILPADLDLVAEPHRGDAVAGIGELLVAQGYTDAFDAVARRCPAQQPAPAAADVEQPLTRTKPQLTADMLELLLLRRVEIFLAGFEIGAGIDHVAVQPEAIEVVGNVVMVAHRCRIPGNSMPAPAE